MTEKQEGYITKNSRFFKPTSQIQTEYLERPTSSEGPFKTILAEGHRLSCLKTLTKPVCFFGIQFAFNLTFLK